jgi:hypothetical protein
MPSHLSWSDHDNHAMNLKRYAWLAVWCMTMAGHAASSPAFEVPKFADGKIPTRTIYVAPSGSDSQGDGSVDRPFQTIRRAARDATPGTAVRLLPGTYPGGTRLEQSRLMEGPLLGPRICTRPCCPVDGEPAPPAWGLPD